MINVTPSIAPKDLYPRRIVCLTEETTETLYLLGAQDRIVGISGYTVRPPQARQEKRRVSAFTSANIEKILALQPDLVLGFSDLQADIAAQLIRHGIAVHVFNQRSVAEIISMMAVVGALVGETEQARILIDSITGALDSMKNSTAPNARRPKVYFEEWNDPLISGIRWVSELIQIAGGEDCFAELGTHSLAKNRIIADPLEVVRRAPDIIVGSWCGKKFQPEQVRARDGWDAIPAVRIGHIYEIKSPDILQPGPAALTDGVQQLHVIIARWRSENDQ